MQPVMFICQKLLKQNVSEIVLFIVCEIYFILVLSKPWIKYPKKGMTSAMQCADETVFTFAM